MPNQKGTLDVLLPSNVWCVGFTLCYVIFEHEFAQTAMSLSDCKVHLDAYACRCGGAIFPSLLRDGSMGYSPGIGRGFAGT